MIVEMKCIAGPCPETLLLQVLPIVLILLLQARRLLCFTRPL